MKIQPFTLTLWSGVDIDAGDATDIEAPVDLVAAGLNLVDLSRIRDAFLLLNLATKASSPQLTLDSYSLSAAGAVWTPVELMSRYYDAAGIFRIPVAEPWGAALRYFRLDATATQISSTHKWTGCSLQFAGNLYLDR